MSDDVEWLNEDIAPQDYSRHCRFQWQCSKLNVTIFRHAKPFSFVSATTVHGARIETSYLVHTLTMTCASQCTTNWPLKWAGSGLRDLNLKFGTPSITFKWIKLRIPKGYYYNISRTILSHCSPIVPTTASIILSFNKIQNGGNLDRPGKRPLKRTEKDRIHESFAFR